MPTPAAFVRLDDGDRSWDQYEMRAASADGLVLAVRDVEVDEESDRDVWVDAVVRRLQDGAGYALLGRDTARAATGEEGVRLRFGRDVNGTPHRYDVIVFKADDHLFLLEVGGTAEVYEARQGEIDAAIERFDIR